MNNKDSFPWSGCILLVLPWLCILFGAFIGVTYLDKVYGWCINEIVQDTVEKNWGIRNFYESCLGEEDHRVDLTIVDASSKREIPFARVWIHGLTVSAALLAPASRINNVTFQIESPPDTLEQRYDGLNRPVRAQWKLFNFSDLKAATFRISIIFYILGPVVFYFLIFMFGLLPLCKGPQSNSVVAVYTLFTFALWGVFLWLHFPHPRNYSSSYLDTWHLMRENESVLRRVLNEQPDIALVELPFLKSLPMENGGDLLNKTFFPGEAQERNIHNGIGFVSKKPFFPYDYIRVNVDLFNYLFYAPELTEENLVEINPKLTYRSLGNGIWLGQYSDYIKAVFYLLLAYLVAFILWAVMCGISIWFLWSDIRGWLKRRKLKLRENQESSSPGSEV